MNFPSLAVSVEDNYPPKLRALGSRIARDNLLIAELQKQLTFIDAPNRFTPSDDRPYWELYIKIIKAHLALVSSVVQFYKAVYTMQIEEKNKRAARVLAIDTELRVKYGTPLSERLHIAQQVTSVEWCKASRANMYDVYPDGRIRGLNEWVGTTDNEIKVAKGCINREKGRLDAIARGKIPGEQPAWLVEKSREAEQARRDAAATQELLHEDAAQGQVLLVDQIKRQVGIPGK